MTRSKFAILLVLLMGLFAMPAWAASASEESPEDAGENTVDARQIADNSFLYDTSIYELSLADATYQGNTVQVVGEVVGDAIRAEENAGKVWITLESIENDHESSISVLMGEDLLGLIDTYGGYNHKGTTLQVRGVFYLACPSHEGIMDIHAENVVLIAKGSVSHDSFDINAFIPGFVLVAIGLLLTLIYTYLRERER